MDNSTNICESTSQSADFDSIRPIQRKGKKLLAEKKRRARINNCLMQIRHLVCEDHKEKDTDLDKMEKAEILEKTLEVLTRLRCDRSNSNVISTHRALASRYVSGFSSCAEESIRYIQNSRLVPAEVKLQLQNHLRRIACKMESTVQVDQQSFTPVSPRSHVSLSSLPLSESLVSYREGLNNSVNERVSRQILNEVPLNGSYNNVSPVCYSTLLTQDNDHQTFLSKRPLPQTKTFNNFISETNVQPISGQYLQSTEKYKGNKPVSPTQNKSLCEHKLISHKELVCHKHGIHSTNILYSSPPSQYINDTTSSKTSPSSLQTFPVPSSTSISPYRDVYSHYGYEPYPTSSLITQFPQLRGSSPLATDKQQTTPSQVVDLCVKPTVIQEISPDTMWRPW